MLFADGYVISGKKEKKLLASYYQLYNIVDLLLPQNV
jgi:hypothetical protein